MREGGDFDFLSIFERPKSTTPPCRQQRDKDGATRFRELSGTQGIFDQMERDYEKHFSEKHSQKDFSSDAMPKAM